MMFIKIPNQPILLNPDLISSVVEVEDGVTRIDIGNRDPHYIKMYFEEIVSLLEQSMSASGKPE